MRTCGIIFTGILIFLSIVPSAMAQDIQADDETGVIYNALLDTSRIELRQIPSSVLQSYHEDPSFQYNVESTLDRLWDRAMAWISQKIEMALLIESIAVGWSILLIGLVLLGLWLLINQVLKLNIRGIFYNSSQPPGDANTEEDIHQINFDGEIEAAIQQEAYRLAIRLTYLQSLKMLTDRALIQWKRDKTNQDYLHEMASSQFHTMFTEITRQFEYIWYGDISIETASFQSSMALFRNFQHQLLNDVTQKNRDVLHA